MITTAPLPDGAHLLRVLVDSPGDMDEVTAPWRRPGDRSWLVGRSTWSLAALVAAASERLGLPARIVLPGWICNQSLWPLRQAGAELVFLPVLSDGRPDWRAAEALGAIDMVMVVHTFGYPVDAMEARAFCARRGAFLIEDAAHVLMPIAGVGEAGDATFYSPHKLLPVPEGGVVVLNPRAEAWADGLARALGRPQPAAGSLKWLGQRLGQMLTPDVLRPLLPQGGQQEFRGDPAARPVPPAAAPSTLACRLLASADLEREAARRCDNAAALRHVVRNLADLRPLFHSDAAVPYRLALRAASPKAATQRYRALRRAHLPVETWPDLPPEVMADPAHAEGAVALRRSVLLLPVHGALLPDRLARAYAKVLR